MKKNTNLNRLNGKDLMTVGIFTAIYLVIYVMVSCVLGLIPILSMFMQFFSSFILGIPMMLYFAKIKKFGMILITYTVNGVLMIFLGMVFGLLTIAIQPIFLIGSILAFIALSLIIVKPEVGILSALFLLPFFSYLPTPTIILAVLISITAFSFIIKAIQGSFKKTYEVLQQVIHFLK